MKFEADKTSEKTGEVLGFVVAYFVAATFLYLLLTFAKKMPASWTYLHPMGIVAAVSLAGTGIKRLLK